MKKIFLLTFIIGTAAFLITSDPADGGRGRGGAVAGRGGFSGGAARVGGGNIGAARPNVSSGGTVNPFGAGVSARSTTPIVGPAGGAGNINRGGGSYTTKGGATIDYKGASAGGTTGRGVTGGRYIGGVEVTGPGGREVTKVGTGGAAVGPRGNAVAGKSGTTIASGPQGSLANRYHSGAVIGPQGAVAGKTQIGGAVGPGGAVVTGSRAGVASGPYGAVAGRSTVVAGRGTYYRSAGVIANQRYYVGSAVAHYPCFRPNWWTRYPGAWYAAGWSSWAAWNAATWAAYSSFYSYPVAQPIYYNFGDNIVYQDDGVYIDGERTASAEQYVKQASNLADTGFDAKLAKDEEFLPLGVFAMVQGDEKTSNHIFQLAASKKGILRGNYYDSVMDTTLPIYGSVDPKTQRAAWTVGERKTPVYEAGIANLTENATTMVVHYANDRSQQFSLVRIEAPDDKDEKK